MTQTFSLNPEQQAALDTILGWFASGDSPFFVLEGYAGTGKTYTMQALLSQLKARVVFTAPTNKATKVLRDTLTRPDYKPETATIYSLLGLRLEATGELKELTGPKDQELDLSSYALVVVDEGSMVNETLMKYIKLVADNYEGVRFLFMGDPAQLPPVKETRSPIWSILDRAVLTKVMRHDNQILSLVTAIRGKVDLPFPKFNLASDNDTTQGVWKLSAPGFEAGILKYADQGGFSEPNHSKIIAWRNVTVDRYNRLVRQQIYGPDAAQRPWIDGDRVIFSEPAKDLDGNIVATTDDEGTVQRVTEGWHPHYGDFKTFAVTIALDTGGSVTARVLHPDSVHLYTERCERMAAEARENRRLWPKFWEFKEAFHNLRHAYAITAHRAQGSTYQNAFVVSTDILMNQNKPEASRCLYVACSRPKHRLFLL